VADAGVLTTKVKLRKVEAIINPLSGSVGPAALAEMKDLLASYGLSANVNAVQPADLSKALETALGRSPDLLIILAGDGTARAACELAGERGPLIAPLPGGTVNVLPRSLYGTRDWKTALTETLEGGVVRDVSGGEIDGRRFYCGAMLGWPALWVKAREAAREKQVQLTLLRARHAWRRAFTGRVRFSLDGKGEERAEALMLLTPLTSKRMTEDKALEVAALNPSGLKDVLRVGFRVAVGEMFGDVFGDWRDDPAVDLGDCRTARAWGRGELPAWLDGEPVRLPTHVKIAFLPKAFRALTPAEQDPAKV
jgi:diacylglycerol kinase family enzyme